VVTYLNADFEGGPTRFPKLGVEYRGGVGDAVIFANVFRDGQPDMNTLHEGAPVTAGRKWVLSQWIRAVPQPMRF
jgi:prolyl 4-hydroxylase